MEGGGEKDMAKRVPGKPTKSRPGKNLRSRDSAGGNRGNTRGEALRAAEGTERRKHTNNTTRRRKKKGKGGTAQKNKKKKMNETKWEEDSIPGRPQNDEKKREREFRLWNVTCPIPGAEKFRNKGTGVPTI